MLKLKRKITPVIVTVLALGSAETSLSSEEHWQKPACTFTTFAAFKACKNEVRDDKWIQLAKCQNLSDVEEQHTCTEEALETFEEDKASCHAQKMARAEICDVLGEAPYDPSIDPNDFVDFAAVIEQNAEFTPNPYLPLIPGNTKEYQVKDAEGKIFEVLKVEVLERTINIAGVNAIVVRDRVWEIDDEGEQSLIEDTDDWFAQDLEGNIWYLGEAVKDYEDGELISLEGSFKHGVDHDKAGVLMMATPQEGTLYREEFSLGNAEDMGEVLGFEESRTVGNTTYSNVLVIKAFSPIEPDVYELKYYAPGVGLIMEEKPEEGEVLEIIN